MRLLCLSITGISVMLSMLVYSVAAEPRAPVSVRSVIPVIGRVPVAMPVKTEPSKSEPLPPVAPPHEIPAAEPITPSAALSGTHVGRIIPVIPSVAAPVLVPQTNAYPVQAASHQQFAPPPTEALPAPVAPQIQTIPLPTISLAEVRRLALANNKDLAVLELSPRIIETDIAAADGVFSPAVGFRSGMGTSFQQVGTEIESFGSVSGTLRTDTVTPLEGPNQLYVEKLFRSGGRIVSGVGAGYQNLDPVGTFVLLNPQWQSTANIAFEQPLFRGRGPVATLAPIRIAQANYEQSIFSVQSTVNGLLRDVDVAYWNSYAAYRQVMACEAILDVATQTWHRETELLRLGQGTVPNVAQAEEQMETYRVSLIDAQNHLAAAERNLRRIIGIHPADPRPLCPAELPPPVQDPIDFASAVGSALQRPEVKQQQAVIEAANVELARAKNLLDPNLTVRLGHSAIGLEDRLDQSISTAAGGRFNSWSAGLIYRRALGQPVEMAAVRRAQLSASREQARYAQLVHNINHELDAAYRNLMDAQRMLEVQHRRRDAAARQREARRVLYNEGRATMLEQLDAESRYATDTLGEIASMQLYQQSLAQWKYVLGTYVTEGVTFTHPNQPTPAPPISHYHGLQPAGVPLPPATNAPLNAPATMPR